MQNLSRCREKTGNWLGRRKNYICRECQTQFQVDTISPLPDIDRVCPDCKARTSVYTFTNTKTGKDKQIRACDSELATLRAWVISPNFTFKIPQSEGID